MSGKKAIIHLSDDEDTDNNNKRQKCTAMEVYGAPKLSDGEPDAMLERAFAPPRPTVRASATAADERMVVFLPRKNKVDILGKFISRGRLEVTCENCDNCNRPVVLTSSQAVATCHWPLDGVNWDILVGDNKLPKFGIMITPANVREHEFRHHSFPWALIDESVIDEITPATKILNVRAVRTVERCNQGYCCWTIKDIAEQMGLMKRHTVYDCKALELLDEARTGMRRCHDVYSAENTGKVKEDTPLWVELRMRGWCLMCKLPKEYIYGRPFCLPCYNVIQGHRKGLDHIYYERVDLARVEFLRDVFNELFKKFSEQENEGRCHLCHVDYDEGDQDDKAAVCENPIVKEFMRTHPTYGLFGAIMPGILWDGVQYDCCDICLTKFCQEKKLLIK